MEDTYHFCREFRTLREHAKLGVHAFGPGIEIHRPDVNRRTVDHCGLSVQAAKRRTGKRGTVIAVETRRTELVQVDPTAKQLDAVTCVSGVDQRHVVRRQ